MYQLFGSCMVLPAFYGGRVVYTCMFVCPTKLYQNVDYDKTFCSLILNLVKPLLASKSKRFRLDCFLIKFCFFLLVLV